MKSIMIYSTPNCPHCKKLKGYLDSKKIKYTDLDISADPQLVGEMIEKSNQMTAPVVDIEGEIIVGFDQEKIDTILGIK